MSDVAPFDEAAFAQMRDRAFAMGVELRRITVDGHERFIVSRWNLSKTLDSAEALGAWLRRAGPQ